MLDSLSTSLSFTTTVLSSCWNGSKDAFIYLACQVKQSFIVPVQPQTVPLNKLDFSPEKTLPILGIVPAYKY